MAPDSPTPVGDRPAWRPHRPVAPGTLRLDQNTNLLGPNPAVAKVQAMPLDVAAYPDPDARALQAAIADANGLPAEAVVPVAGGEEAFDAILRAFAPRGATIATPVPGFELHAEPEPRLGLKVARVPMRSGHRELDVDALVAARPAVTFVANPNNPTGLRVPTAQLEELAERLPGLLVVDEAYIEYAGLRHSLVPRTQELGNLAVVRSLSKAYGLAGARVGWISLPPRLAPAVRACLPEASLGTHTQALAVAALEEQEWVDACVATVRAERERMAACLKRLGFRVQPSDASFLLAAPPIDASELALALRAKGIFVAAYPEGPVAGCVRISIGGPKHTDALLAALQTIITSGG